jgi:hypothetical protein
MKFRNLLKTLDSLSCELHRQGVGVVKHSAKVIDLEHEAILWEKSLLGYSTMYCVFFVGLHFALRGVQEQHDLVPLQFVHMPPDYIYDALV